MASAYPGCRALVEEALQLGGVPESAFEVCLASITPSTLKQYNSGLRLWWQFCNDNKINVFSLSIPNILEFFMELYRKGMSYGSLNSCRSAIAQLLGPTIAQDNRIKRFFRGVLYLRPSKPKYENTWDPSGVLNFLRNMNNYNISLEKLSCKLAMLLALSTGQRVQTLSLIEVCNIRTHSEGVEIKVPKRVKTSGLNRHQPILSLPFYPSDPNICVASTLLFYVEKTSSYRHSNVCNNLFITFKKPFHNASSQSISRWIRKVMSESGIDTSIFTPHSTRHASTSKAYSKGISCDIIRSAAGWSNNSKSFAMFYNRPIRDSSSFATSVLES